MHGPKPRQESDLLFLHVSYPICKSLDVSTDSLVDRHTWSPHGKGRDGVPSYRRLARGQVGSEASRKQECLLQWIHTRCTMMRRTLPWCKKRSAEHSKTFRKTQGLTVQMDVYASTHLSAPWRCQVIMFWATFTSTWLPIATTVCQPRQPVCSTTTQSGVFWALDMSLRALAPFALPTMPSCLLRLHQNCPSATTKLRASLRASQPRQPVTATLNHKITCWEADIRGDSFQNEISIMWLKTKSAIKLVCKNETLCLDMADSSWTRKFYLIFWNNFLMCWWSLISAI